ncbi:hypothetical protein I4U23_005751 [Adineta vaga]|nr:hypothetical protein I4U23_005751 [Adineta vaga]
MSFVKKQRGLYLKEKLEEAIRDVKEGRMTSADASREHNVPSSTIRCHVNGISPRIGAGRSSYINSEQEKYLVEMIKYLEGVGVRLTKEVLRKICNEYVNLVSNNFRSIDNELSLHWINNFLIRNKNDIKMIKEKKLEKSRRDGFSEEVRKGYFANVKQVLEKNDLLYKPLQIWNVDESGFNDDTQIASVSGGFRRAGLSPFDDEAMKHKVVRPRPSLNNPTTAGSSATTILSDIMNIVNTSGGNGNGGNNPSYSHQTINNLATSSHSRQPTFDDSDDDDDDSFDDLYDGSDDNQHNKSNLHDVVDSRTNKKRKTVESDTSDEDYDLSSNRNVTSSTNTSTLAPARTSPRTAVQSIITTYLNKSITSGTSTITKPNPRIRVERRYGEEITSGNLLDELKKKDAAKETKSNTSKAVKQSNYSLVLKLKATSFIVTKIEFDMGYNIARRTFARFPRSKNSWSVDIWEIALETTEAVHNFIPLISPLLDFAIMDNLVSFERGESKDYSYAKIFLIDHKIKTNDQAVTENVYLIPHSSKPVNEYFNPKFLTGLYPTLFCYGQHIRYLLSYNDRRFETNHSFIFVIFNLLQRRDACFHAQLIATKPYFQASANEIQSINSKDIEAALDNNIKRTYNTEADSALNKLLQHIKTVGGRVMVSAYSRTTLRTRIHALIFNQGLPSIFLTINPADC